MEKHTVLEDWDCPHYPSNHVISENCRQVVFQYIPIDHPWISIEMGSHQRYVYHSTSPFESQGYYHSYTVSLRCGVDVKWAQWSTQAHKEHPEKKQVLERFVIIVVTTTVTTTCIAETGQAAADGMGSGDTSDGYEDEGALVAGQTEVVGADTSTGSCPPTDTVYSVDETSLKGYVVVDSQDESYDQG